MNKAILSTLLVIGGLLSSFTGKPQLSVLGATCVLAGQEYRYTLSGSLVANEQLCISGGVLADSNSTCTTDLSAGYVRVVWTGTSGTLTISSDSGSFNLLVSVTSPLQAGEIDASEAQQIIAFDSIPAGLHCSSATGGGCSPVYQYQWQRSTDKLEWEDITGSIAHDLTFTASLNQSTFFRRKTTDVSSGTIVYSNAAVVFLNAYTN